MCDVPSHKRLYLWEHLPAASYISRNGAVGLLGDAAHATTPWQGSGAGMSIEDSLILSSLLGGAQSTSEVRAALRVYDSVRRPRTQQVVKSSKGVGVMWSGQDAETGLSAAKLREKLRTQWDFILKFDVQEHKNQALAMMRQELYPPLLDRK